MSCFNSQDSGLEYARSFVHVCRLLIVARLLKSLLEWLEWSLDSFLESVLLSTLLKFRSVFSPHRGISKLTIELSYPVSITFVGSHGGGASHTACDHQRLQQHRASARGFDA